VGQHFDAARLTRVISSITTVGLALAMCGGTSSASTLKWVERAHFTNVPYAISCSSSRVCNGISNDGTFVVRTKDGGEKWSFQNLNVTSGDITSMSCPTTSFCFAAGSAWAPGVPALEGGDVSVVSLDGGATWEVGYPGTVYQPGILANATCTSETWCIASDENQVFATSSGSYGGWSSAAKFNLNLSVEGLYCHSRQNCLALLGPASVATQQDDHIDHETLMESVNGGANWTRVSTLPLGTSDLACTTKDSCTAIGLGGSNVALFISKDGGKLWAKQSIPHTGRSTISAASCFSSKICVVDVAAGYEKNLFERTTNGGKSWSNESLPKGNFLVFNIDCQGSNSCIAVGQKFGPGQIPEAGVILTYG
jgi:hypothetical protein